MRALIRLSVLTLLLAATSQVYAACRDPVVLVHGNTASPASWDNTVAALRAAGYQSSEIYLPDWGSKTCAACNNHYGSEETPVREAISNAINASCSGRIDVIGHSMGVTLAAQQIDKLAVASYIDAFIGVAGAARGLWSCGVYPYNVWSSTCGYYGLSVQSPFLDSLYGAALGSRVYSIKSYMDQVVCSTGTCTVGGVHSSRLWYEDATFTYALGHFGLQTDTSSKQVQLLD